MLPPSAAPALREVEGCLKLDGASGEGGGQVLRTALSLALLSGRPFEIERIRHHRARPGLQRQHLASVEAALRVSGARVTGAALGSSQLSFQPGSVRPGTYSFAIGSAGSATLVLQTILLPLLLASGPSRVTLEGGTHNPWAPPFDFLAHAFLPLLQRMGARVTARLERFGFYPAGGGRIEIGIEPLAALRPLELVERGKLKACRLRGIASGLPRAFAARAVDGALSVLRRSDAYVDVREVPSAGPGYVLMIELLSEHGAEVVTGFGEKGVRPEEVGEQAGRAALDYLESGAPVGAHLADQLLLPLALAGGGRFVTVAPSRHTATNLEVVRQFSDVALRIEPVGHGRWQVEAGA